MSMNAVTAPAGWYPDPTGTGLLRWWNGDAWTEHVEEPRPEIQPALGTVPRRRGRHA